MNTKITRTGHVIGTYNGKVIEGEAWCEKFLDTTWSPRFLIKRYPKRLWPPRRRYPYDWAVQGV